MIIIRQQMVSIGSARGHQVVTKVFARGHQEVSQGYLTVARSHQEVNQGPLGDQLRVTRGPDKGHQELRESD